MGRALNKEQIHGVARPRGGSWPPQGCSWGWQGPGGCAQDGPTGNSGQNGPVTHALQHPPTSCWFTFPLGSGSVWWCDRWDVERGSSWGHRVRKRGSHEIGGPAQRPAHKQRGRSRGRGPSAELWISTGCGMRLGTGPTWGGGTVPPQPRKEPGITSEQAGTGQGRGGGGVRGRTGSGPSPLGQEPTVGTMPRREAQVHSSQTTKRSSQPSVSLTFPEGDLQKLLFESLTHCVRGPACAGPPTPHTPCWADQRKGVL